MKNSFEKFSSIEKESVKHIKGCLFLYVHSENREHFFSSLLHFKNAEYWNGKHEANCQAMQFPCGEIITCSCAALFIACSSSNQITLTNMVLSIARCGTCYAASSFWQTKWNRQFFSLCNQPSVTLWDSQGVSGSAVKCQLVMLRTQKVKKIVEEAVQYNSPLQCP